MAHIRNNITEEYRNAQRATDVPQKYLRWHRERSIVGRRAPHERVDAMPKLVINGRKQSKSVFGGATGKKRAKTKTPRQQVRPRQSFA